MIGLLAWPYLAAQITVYAAETNVVLARRLWPRSLLQPPLTDADEQVLRSVARQEERRPEQHVDVSFHDPDGPGDTTGADHAEQPSAPSAPSSPKAGTESTESRPKPPNGSPPCSDTSQSG
ncbi:hypothetical protein [Kitasatospora sp. NPDC056531]|uniref:hypothetical protein n=1 Tax=Kitasatospora sp. NPDC056531 TaxID=3345856 RepID=UPI0036C9462A